MIDRDRVLNGKGFVPGSDKAVASGPSDSERLAFLHDKIEVIHANPYESKVSKEGMVEALNMSEAEIMKFPKAMDMLGLVFQKPEVVEKPKTKLKKVKTKKDEPIDDTFIPEPAPKLVREGHDMNDPRAKAAAALGITPPSKSNKGLSDEDLADREGRVTREEIEDVIPEGMTEVKTTLKDEDFPNNELDEV